MKKLFLGVAAVAAMMFVACGNDSSTDAGDGGSDAAMMSSSSSSNVIPNSASVIPSDSTTAIPDDNSTVIPGSDRGSSSSSLSSSATTEDLAPSSSSVKSASSSSSTAKSSSSSALSSSSREDSGNSSSSEYVPFDHKNFLASELTVGKDRYSQFTDERNGRSYYYITITGKDTSGKANTVTVMAENLNIGDMIYGWEDQMDDTKIERYCYDDDTTYCDKYGGLYQWSEMMALPNKCNTESCADSIKPNHQGICPNGWRLLTYNDIYTIIRADGNDEGLAGIRSTYQFGGFNTTGYSLVGAGYNWGYSYDGVKTTAYWFYLDEIDELRVKSSFSLSNSTILEMSTELKTQGFSVRCVMVENP